MMIELTLTKNKLKEKEKELNKTFLINNELREEIKQLKMKIKDEKQKI